ncbi:unnamed protein product, partial [Meganyctiphanes norvegica]
VSIYLIHRMTARKIKERTDFLVKFLDLPPPNRLVSQLSGGQQRRVSFAAALLHEPPLLILDEPTVGVDPLLRTNIWSHLIEISRTSNTTIIITTHYIEEAKQADMVGLMRAGRLLAEASPEGLIKHFSIPSLEEIFLKLCLQDGDADELEMKHHHGKNNIGFTNENDMQLEAVTSDTNRNSSQEGGFRLKKIRSKATQHIILKEPDGDDSIYKEEWKETGKYENFFSWGRFVALLIKNMIRMKRNLGFLLFSFLMPPMQTCLFCLAIGGMPYNLPVAIINEDLGLDPILEVISDLPFIPDLPNPYNDTLGQLYIDKLNDKTISKIYYDDYEDGYSAVKDGHAWSMIYLNENFTSGIIAEALGDSYPSITNHTSQFRGQGSVDIYMDNTNQQIAWTMDYEILNALDKFSLYLLNQTEFDASHLRLPIEMTLVYGSSNPSFTEFMAPGVIITITYFMAVGLTALSFIIERKEGLLDRSWVAGVHTSEVMLSHLVTQMVVMIIQIGLILVFMFPVFGIPCEGSMVLVILLSVLQGLCGMTFGLMISAASDNEMTAIQLALGCFYPIILLSGIVWPVQGMPQGFRYFSYFLPNTFACESLRAILYKGWGIDHFVVYMGFIVSFIWLIIHALLAEVLLWLRK